MQIKIDIDVEPEELRRFLGLPDVAGLQEELLQFVRDKVGQVNENLNPSDFVKGNLETLNQTAAFKKLLARINLNIDEDGNASTAEPPKPRARKKSGSAATKRTKKSAGKS